MRRAIDRFETEFDNKVSLTQNDPINNLPSPTYQDQDQSFQEFQKFDQEEKPVDSFSAFEPYSTIVNKQKKMPQRDLSVK